MTDWVQFTVDVPRPHSDVVCGDLWAVGVGGIEERPSAGGDGGDGWVQLVIGLETHVLDDAQAVLERHGLVPAVHEVTA